MIFGYGRVSTRDQNLDLQVDALNAAGCHELFLEKITGTKKNRPELNRLRATLREGDVVVVWKLDRWGRSLPDLIELMNELRGKKVEFRCLSLSMDTTTIEGRLIYGIFAVLAEFVRDTISENTKAGLASARARGRVGGRPKGLSPKAQKVADYVMFLYQAGNTVVKIREMTNIASSRTVYKYLRYKNVPISDEEKQEADRIASQPVVLEMQ